MKALLRVHQKADREVYKLDSKVKAKYVDFCHRFRQDPDIPGLDLKPLKGDSRVYRAKINDSYRALLARVGVDVEGRQEWALLSVRHRKDVYEELSIAVNRVTGELEFIDLSSGGDSLVRRTGLALTPAEPDAPLEQAGDTTATGSGTAPMLTGVTAEELRSLGVEDRLSTLALAADADELDRLIEGAPPLSKDVLTGLAAGMPLDEVRREITEPVAVDLADDYADDLSAALDRTPVTTVDDDLKDVLAEGDFRDWKVFLHPTQHKIVTRHYNGPARASGGPGTGKTIVALHRVKHLAEHLHGGDDKPILLTSFTKNLTTDLRARLASLLRPEHFDRVEIAHVDQLAARVLAETRADDSRKQRVSDGVAQHVLAQILDGIGERDLTATFLFEEWDQVILGQALATRKDYFAARRPGRGRLTRPDRNRVWKILEVLTARLDKQGQETWGQAAERAARAERDRAARVTGDSDDTNDSGIQYRSHRYRHIVVDEAQDLRASHWIMLRSMAPEAPNDLFIAGDTHQRIYDHQVTLSTVGINIRGRSTRLTLSYRSTREILDYATGIVAVGGSEYDDLDDGKETLDGYRSVLRGRAPQRAGYNEWREELDALTQSLRSWREDPGATRGTIAVCAPDRNKVTDVIDHLTGEGITCAELTKNGPVTDGEIHVGTVHRFKGLEYQRIAMVGMNDGVIPRTAILDRLSTEDPKRFAREERKYRSLLFVAATRARDVLRITWHGERSRYLPE